MAAAATMTGSESRGSDIFSRFSRLEGDIDCRQAARLCVHRDGDRLLFQTGEKSVRKSRLLARLMGAACMAVGIVSTHMTVWGWLLLILGALAFFVLPLLARTAVYLEISAAEEPGQIRVFPHVACPGIVLPLTQVSAIRGIYETQGWDPRSVLFAVLADGSEVPLLTLPGTDEALAEHACRTLGLLLDCPSTYTGPFGGVKTCGTASGALLS